MVDEKEVANTPAYYDYCGKKVLWTCAIKHNGFIM
jgi:hypothetical protein